MEVLVNAFKKHLDLEKVKYENEIKSKLEIFENTTKTYNSKYLYLEEINVKNSVFTSKISNGILIRKIFAENSRIVLKLEGDFLIVHDEVYGKGNVEYLVYGKVKEAYHYFRLMPFENSDISSKVRSVVEKSLVSIGVIFIDENAVNSFGSMDKLFLLKEGANVISFPILDVKNSSSKAFHSSKTVRMEEEQINYLMLKGLTLKDIETLFEKSFEE
ncbi:MAG: SufD family Fe-S cluster assembly protein [Candidatus Aenigmatarchaeota archaeon]